MVRFEEIEVLLVTLFFCCACTLFLHYLLIDTLLMRWPRLYIGQGYTYNLLCFTSYLACISSIAFLCVCVCVARMSLLLVKKGYPAILSLLNCLNANYAGLGWTYPCDMWSIGCILVELCSVSLKFLWLSWNVNHLIRNLDIGSWIKFLSGRSLVSDT